MPRSLNDLNLGRGIVTLYRGLNRHPDDVNMDELGTHWSTDYEVAKQFATAGMGLPNLNKDRSHGTIVQATFNQADIVPEGSTEHKNWHEGGGSDGMGTYGLDSSEKEITIRRGAKPDIDKVHHLQWNPETKQAE
jgi:hypothetical protein